MQLFSERNKIRNTITGPEEMPDGFRNRVWNALADAIQEDHYNSSDLIKKSWSDFYKKDVSDLHRTTSYR